MPSIKKNFFYSSILTTANYIFPLLTFPYASRVLGVTNIGIVNFVDSIIHYFILVSMMGINIVGIREIAKSKGNKEQLSKTFSGLFWLNTLTTTIALIVVVLLTMFVEPLREHWQMVLIGGFKLIMNYMLIEWLYRGLEEFKYITIRTIAVKTLYVISVFVFVRGANDYPIYYFLSVMMIVANSVINLIYSKQYVSFKVTNVQVFYFVKPFFILGLYNLLNSMYISVNVMWLGFVSGETEVGYYTTASKIYSILIALFTAFTGVMLPRMSSLIAEGKMDEFRSKLKRAYNLLFTFSIPLIIFTILYTPHIIYIISGPGYEGAIIPMRIMMPLMLIIGYEQILVIQTLMPLKKDNAILRNSIIGAVTGLVLNIMLVSTYASVGAALVWIGSELVVLCSAQYFVSKFVKLDFPWLSLSKMVFLYLPLIILLFLIKAYFNAWYSILISCGIMLIYILVGNIVLVPNMEFVSLLRSCKSIINRR